LKSAKWENIFKGWNRSESRTVVTLKQVPVFKDFSQKEFSELEKLIHHRNYSSGDYIFKNRAPGEGIAPEIISLKIEPLVKECISSCTDQLRLQLVLEKITRMY